MIKDKYQRQISSFLRKRFSPDEVKALVFGSSLRKDTFHDIDIGLVGMKGNIDPLKLSYLREDFEESLIPYTVDVVDMNKADALFKDKVMKGTVLWLEY